MPQSSGTPAKPASSFTELSPALRSAIDAFVVMDVMREANARERGGQDIIHMEVGQPGTPAPRLAREAAKRAIDTQMLGYTDALGAPELRTRISQSYRERYGLSVDPSRIIVTTGSSAGFVLAFLGLLNPGDALALPQPGYPCYRQIAKLVGLTPIDVAARNDSSFKPIIGDLEHLYGQGARALILASPANPTGVMLNEAELKAIVTKVERARFWFISDEIYHGLTYATRPHTALSFSDEAIVINSFSKYYSMTGWRIGWIVIPERLVRVFERLAQNLYISAPAISQAAALAAFDATDELEAYKEVYAANRAMLLNELPKAGFNKLAPPDGAFYLYADVSHLTDDSEVLVRRMLAEIGVAATSGIDFDQTHGRRFVRFSYAGTFERMKEAAGRLQNWRK